MKLNKDGWSMSEMLLLMGGLLIFLVIAVYFIIVYSKGFHNITTIPTESLPNTQIKKP